MPTISIVENCSFEDLLKKFERVCGKDFFGGKRSVFDPSPIPPSDIYGLIDGLKKIFDDVELSSNGESTTIVIVDKNIVGKFFIPAENYEELVNILQGYFYRVEAVRAKTGRRPVQNPINNILGVPMTRDLKARLPRTHGGARIDQKWVREAILEKLERGS